MKKSLIFLLVCILIPTSGSAFDEKKFDEIIKRIPNSNYKLVEFHRSILKEIDAALKIHDEKKDAELLKKTLPFSVCLNAPNTQFQQIKYFELLKEFEKQMTLFQPRIEQLQKSETYKVELEKFMSELTDKKNEHKCEEMFIVPEKDMAAQAKDVHEKYIEFMNLKKVAHPLFVRFINKFTETDSKSTQYENERKTLDNIHINGVLIEDEEVVKVISEFKKTCPISVKELYGKLCQSDIKYSSIPYENFRFLYCIVDNLKSDMVKNNPNCKNIK